ncbi:MAG: arsenosugar biosynthesis radical SAM protein ArsS [Planctomycetota bacterium]|nr:arsenosugar biosynthesis radical SAM protein ArsS [Planctomycetota bacterium]
MTPPPDGAKLLETLVQSGSPLASGAAQLRVLERLPIVDRHGASFDAHIASTSLRELRASKIDVFQINVGKLCNQTCAHCHVDAGPTRTEAMTRDTAELAMRVLATTSIPTVDITGGAPELNANFRYLVEESRRLGRHVVDRCNLTILTTARGADLPQFLARNRVEVVCSLPHYRELSTDKQRGEGVYARSIEALKMLNAVGYGQGTGLRLVLVTNPVGAILPSSSHDAALREWKDALRRTHGIEFDDLYTITNMPISRFLEWLERTGNLESYLQRLVTAFNPIAAQGVMCRNTLSVGWDGRLYDCDFNQMLELEVGDGAPRHLRDFDLASLEGRRIVTNRHCFGCTAGAGSSCGGQTT